MHVVDEDHAINKGRTERVKYFGLAFLVGLLLLLNVTGVLRQVFGVDTALVLTLIAGYKTFQRAIAELLEKRISADLAICVAAIAAFAVGEYLAAAEAMFIMLLGEGLEAYAAGRAQAAIHRFVEQLPHHACVLRDGRELEVPVEDLVTDDLILVRAAERVAADGLIEVGHSSIDESPITGESLPRDKGPGDQVYSGTINTHGLLHVRVTRAGEDSTLARVIRLVESAKRRKAPVVRLADRYARYFLPALLLAAGATFYFTGEWLRTVAVLIVGCPCALILATPSAMVAGIGGLARRGILVRSGAALQAASEVDTVVLDKTGTLTSGRFRILKILPVNGRCEDEVLALAASAESGSEHPLASVITETARSRQIVFETASEARVFPGRGAESVVGGRTVRAGNSVFFDDYGIVGYGPLLEEADWHGATAVLVAAEDSLAGAILLRDSPRPGAAEAIHEFEHLGITRIVMLTGDRRRAAEAIAREVGITEVEAELLPEQKLDRIRELQSQGRLVAMIGDGVNDAPALAAANVGIAVAGSGADLVAEAADVVDLNASLWKLPRLFEVSQRTVATIWQNIIVFAGIVNVVAILAAGGGYLGPLGAAVVHQLASILVMLNSVRLLKVERTHGETPWWRRWLDRSGIENTLEILTDRLRRLDPIGGMVWLWDIRRRLGRPALYASTAVWIFCGVYVIPPEEMGVVERFGRKVLPHKGPGIHYKLPFPIERLTRVNASRVRSIEIGFRTSRDAAFREVPVYEWNVQHREGRFQPQPEEALMLTGDQNMVEVTASVHYNLERLEDYLFQQSDPETTVRVAAESVLQGLVNSTSLDDLLTTGRATLERRAAAELQWKMTDYRSGVRVLLVKLQDVHPSVEVVDAFRQVAGALEEKNRLVNESEGYRNEQVALARGRAQARIREAEGYRFARTHRAQGEASRFEQLERAYRLAPGVTGSRLYLETMEEILPGRRKLILDSKSGGRRALYSVEGGVLLAPSGASMTQPPATFPLPQEEP